MRRLSLLALCLFCLPGRAAPLPGTQPLERTGDLAAQMVEGIDKYLMRALTAAPEGRKEHWKIDLSSREAYLKTIEPNRQRLKKILGVIDSRVPCTGFELVGTTDQPALVADSDAYKVFAVRWPVLPGVDGEGLLLEPKGKVFAQVVALPDADTTPESAIGLDGTVRPDAQFARRLAECGCRVLVPVLINRRDDWSANPRLGRASNQPHREFLYRMAYQVGRHLIGYEVQKVLAAVDGFCRDKAHPPVLVFGEGEGGMLAWFSAAIDPRIDAVAVSGYSGVNERLWQQPIYRNVFSLVRDFGDSDLAMLVLPRKLVIEMSQGPVIDGPPAPRPGRGGAAPGRLDPQHDGHPHPARAVQAAREKIGGEVIEVDDGQTPGGEPTLKALLLGTTALTKIAPNKWPAPNDLRKDFDPQPRQKRQFDQLVHFTQQAMRDTEAHRAATFWAKLDTSSLEKYQASTAPFRKQLWEEVLGKLPAPTEPIAPRTRQAYDEPKWKGYEVTLDLFPDVFAQGILLVPKDLAPGERRPVVVCQHGLEGRPADVVNPSKRTPYYNSFGAQLADRGYIVYAPQNPYIFNDKFRVLQRKANPLGLSLFSFIVRQHERTLDWLATLPFVDPERMAFYGLSYGGKTAMRVPALLPRYCLSICSGDFNEWTWKNASVDYVNSYAFSMEYEMPEFDLARTMVYAEMAALIAPRPFMVERGHDDGVGIDEWVAYEYAKVRRLYSRLRIPERTAIEFFAGGHEIHGMGTFAFLQKHLKYPK